MQVFGEKLKLSRIAEVPRAQSRLPLILNFLEKPNKENPSVNNTTDR